MRLMMRLGSGLRSLPETPKRWSAGPGSEHGCQNQRCAAEPKREIAGLEIDSAGRTIKFLFFWFMKREPAGGAGVKCEAWSSRAARVPCLASDLEQFT